MNDKPEPPAPDDGAQAQPSQRQTVATLLWHAWDTPDRIASSPDIKNLTGDGVPRLLIMPFANGYLKFSATRRPHYLIYATHAAAKKRKTRILSILVSEPKHGLPRVCDILSKRLQLDGFRNTGGYTFEATSVGQVIAVLRSLYPGLASLPPAPEAIDPIIPGNAKENHAMPEHHDLPKDGVSLAIAGTAIRKDLEGRYCLNDLHKAAGGLSKDRPSKWLDADTTQKLVAELDAEKPASQQNQSLKVHKGGDGWQGTFVVKELVYAYAMWISPKFHLAVIRAFDAMMMGEMRHLEQAQSAHVPTEIDRAIDARAWRLAEQERQRIMRLLGRRQEHEGAVWDLAYLMRESFREELYQTVRKMRHNPSNMVLAHVTTWKPFDGDYAYAN